MIFNENYAFRRHPIFLLFFTSYIRDNDTVDPRTCEVGATLAALNVGS
jgi:hypothetical protein